MRVGIPSLEEVYLSMAECNICAIQRLFPDFAPEHVEHAEHGAYPELVTLAQALLGLDILDRTQATDRLNALLAEEYDPEKYAEVAALYGLDWDDLLAKQTQEGVPDQRKGKLDVIDF